MMSDKKLVIVKFDNGNAKIYPTEKPADNWQFEEYEENEAMLAACVAKVAKANGLTTNDTHHVFPFILRMLKSKSVWAE